MAIGLNGVLIDAFVDLSTTSVISQAKDPNGFELGCDSEKV